MNFQQFLYILFAIIIFLQILIELLRWWRRGHSEQIVYGVAFPPEFEADVHRLQQLEARRQQDPQVIMPLIQIYRRILERLQPDEAPMFYAAVQNNLGVAYSNLPTGDRVDNLSQAIASYEKALRFRTPATVPLDYAATQHNLGTAYYSLPIGDPTANLTRAIAYYQEALLFCTPETAPLNYAMIQNNLGVAYRALPTGNRMAQIDQAITCYKQALRFYTPETAPLDYAGVQNNLGSIYSNLLTGDPIDNLAQAITCYKEALRFYTPKSAPFNYAGTQHNLGKAYSDLPTGDHLTQAIACYKEALRFRTPKAVPLDYAMTQHNLGNAYLYLQTDDRATNLRRAIMCYEEALRFCTPEAMPLDYATTQNSLGVAYSDLPTDDRTLNLRRAIDCYEKALRFRTPEAVPLDYATTQNNLGIAYGKLSTGDRTANLAQAIVYFQEALRFRLPEVAPLDYAATQNNLGNAYSILLTDDRESSLSQAITCYEEALRFRIPKVAPLDYAMTQYNLGNAYLHLQTGDRATNLRQAIVCYEQALRFYTPEVVPFDYAMAQNNLGLTYSKLPTGDRAVNRVQAISCFQRALRFYTPEFAPFECRMANYNLANHYFAQKDWGAALDAYRAAIDAGERLYHASLFVESKEVDIAEDAALYRHAAFASVRCGQITEALLILEQGKTRLLTEALRLRVSRPVGVPEEIWFAFEHAAASVRAVQSERTVMGSEVYGSKQAYAAREQMVRAANTALDIAVKRIHVYNQKFLQAIDLPTIQALLPDKHTVLVAFCITDQGSIAFGIAHNNDQHVQVVEIPTFNLADLRLLLVEWDADGGTVGGWLKAYDRYLKEGTQAALDVWQATITRTLMVLGQSLLAPVLSALPPGIERIIFLPSAELFLLPLHAAPLSGNGSELVCDRYQVSYASSIEVLADVQARAVQEVMPDLYAVINPQEDPHLLFTLIESAAITDFFAKHKTDEGRVGTKQHVIAGVYGRTYVHFSCHGHYDWDNPSISSLALADGRLTLTDLQRGVVDLSTVRLVTLSACETGIADIVYNNAEEYVGIPAGFQLAGVPCVVSSLWAVPDLSTALLMERFYSNHLRQGMNIAAALREAQLWIRELHVGEIANHIGRWYRQIRMSDTRELFVWMRYYRHLEQQNSDLRPFAHPYYWAAFTVNGW